VMVDQLFSQKYTTLRHTIIFFSKIFFSKK